MKKKSVVYSIIMAMAMMFIWTNAVFAGASLSEIQAKLAAAKKVSEVTTLADVQAELKKAKNQLELQRIQNISNNFGTTDLHALELTKDYEGDTIGEVAKVVSGAGLRNIKDIVVGNGLSMEDCKSLKPGFVFYIPTKMIAKGLIINAFEVAKLQRRLKLAESSNKELKVELATAREDLEASNSIITALNEKIVKQEGVISNQKLNIENLEKDLLVANGTIAEQQKKLTAMEITGEMLKTKAGDLITILLAVIVLGTIVGLFFFVKFLILNRRHKNEKPVKQQLFEETEKAVTEFEFEFESVSTLDEDLNSPDENRGKSGEKDIDTSKRPLTQ